jgi:hypothetical protein
MQAPLQPTHLTWRITHDAARVHDLHRDVLAHTPQGMVRPDPLAHFESHAGESGQTLGCFASDGALVGYGVLGLRSNTVAHLADLLTVDSADLCLLDGAAALSVWRGHGIHRQSIEHRMALGRKMGRSLVAATVAPDNVRSMRALLDAGLRICHFACMYGGLPRLVLQGDLSGAHPAAEIRLSVQVRDLAAHQAALDTGLTGRACRQDAAGAWVVDYACS